MSVNNKRHILAKGEEYIVPYKLTNTGSNNDKRPSFDEARLRLSREINKALNIIDNTPKQFLLNEIVINVRMHIDYSAKSYHPSAFISKIDAEDIGSKKWTKEINTKKSKDSSNTKIGKEIFLRVTRHTLENLEKQLISGEDFNNSTRDNIRSIDYLYFDTHTHLIEKFKDDWNEGKVEIVLHPFKDKKEEITHLLNLIEQYGGDKSEVRYKTYNSGITFASVLLNKSILENILKYNPIRTAHPIFIKHLPTIRSGGPSIKLPRPPKNIIKSTIKVGIFDGGIEGTNPYLSNYVKENNPISTPKNKDFLLHGTGVVGSVLYGDISKYESNDVLPDPIINAESFRVFPLSNDKDIDLYEIIDTIEEIVPNRPDIQVYNLSIGPYGAIDDDNITRFTYAIDELSKKGDKLFVVAVGNDGDLGIDELCRIQAPSDAVNCLAVGAYKKNHKGELSRAEYSSYGDGREGCKIKPDFLEFGGNENYPFQLISTDGINRNFSCGTSFSAPLVSAKAAEIIGRSNIGNPLLARALLIHTAKHPVNKTDKFLGHGMVKENTEDILSCDGNSVTLVYQSKLRPTQAIKLPFPFIDDLNNKGKVVIKYTIAVATEVDPKNSEDYTLSCIEDTFYSNINKFSIYKIINNKRKTKTVDINTDKELIEEFQKDGWVMSKNPKSYSSFSNKYKTEEERKKNFKWDTVIKRRAKLYYSKISSPYLVLHAMNRYESKTEFVNYAVIVTVDYLDCEEDIYQLTLNKYNKLEVTEVRALNEILIQ